MVFTSVSTCDGALGGNLGAKGPGRQEEAEKKWPAR